MTFSTEWEALYRANRHRSVWPWSDVVTYVHRFAKPLSEFHRVLEVGCGAGANIRLFEELGMDYCAIDGSAAAVALVHDVHPNLKDKVKVGDFTQSIPFDGQFDLVADRASLSHNGTEAIRRTLGLLFDALRPGGKFIGIDWFSAAHQSAGEGTAVDAHTRRDFTSGPLAGTGVVHFCDREHIVDLLETAGFRVECLEHKQTEIVIPAGVTREAVWNFSAARP